MNLAKRQNGIGLIGFLIFVLLLGFFLLVAWKLAPAYWENYAVKQTLKSVAKRPDLVSSSDRLGNNIKNYILKDFRINNVDNIPNSAIQVGRKGPDYEIRIKYEVRVHMLANVDAIVAFDNSQRVSKK